MPRRCPSAPSPHVKHTIVSLMGLKVKRGGEKSRPHRTLEAQKGRTVGGTAAIRAHRRRSPGDINHPKRSYQSNLKKRQKSPPCAPRPSASHAPLRSLTMSSCRPLTKDTKKRKDMRKRRSRTRAEGRYGRPRGRRSFGGLSQRDRLQPSALPDHPPREKDVGETQLPIRGGHVLVLGPARGERGGIHPQRRGQRYCTAPPHRHSTLEREAHEPHCLPPHGADCVQMHRRPCAHRYPHTTPCWECPIHSWPRPFKNKAVMRVFCFFFFFFFLMLICIDVYYFYFRICSSGDGAAVLVIVFCVADWGFRGQNNFKRQQSSKREQRNNNGKLDRNVQALFMNVNLLRK